MDDDVALGLEDIAPIIGQQQLTIITQAKLITRLKEQRDEALKMMAEQKSLDEHADADLAAVDGHLES